MPVTHMLDRFPHKEFDLHNCRPTYALIQLINQKLNANASAIHSTLSDGRHGLLGLTLPPAVCNTITNVPFVRPINPGPRPIIPTNATARATLASQDRHAKALASFKEVEDVDQTLKSLLLQSFDDMYFTSLKNTYTGFSNVSTLDILTHLHSTYGRIKANDLKSNTEKMTSEWNPTNPIENVFKQIEDGQLYASCGNVPFSDLQLVNMAHNIITDAGIMTKACKEWVKRPLQHRIWPHFKLHFSEAYSEYEEFDQNSNINQYAANVQQNMSEYAAMTQSQSIAIRELQETNATLTTLVQNLTNQLQITNDNRNRSRRDNGGRGGGGRGRSNDQQNQSNRTYSHYCWSHGYNTSHGSDTCRNRAVGHCVEATHSNRMGGCLLNQHRYRQN